MTSEWNPGVVAGFDVAAPAQRDVSVIAVIGTQHSHYWTVPSNEHERVVSLIRSLREKSSASYRTGRVHTVSRRLAAFMEELDRIAPRSTVSSPKTGTPPTTPS